MKDKILVMEDDVDVRTYLVSLFEDKGYTVYAAGDVTEGLRQTGEHTPDLITLDIEMPGEWGPRFYRKLSQNPGLKDIPVIVISGLPGFRHAVPKAVAAISKPFDPDALLKLVKETLK